MRLRSLLLTATISLLLAPASSANGLPRLDPQDLFGTTTGGVPTIPADWAGVWQITDSTFTCLGMFFGADVGQLDTLCTGLPIGEDDPTGELELICSGTATSTEVHVTCTGSGPVDVDCDATVTITIDGVRTGDSYTATLVSNIVTMGTGVGCGSSFCTETRTYGTRVAPEPTAYCSTQTTTTTWGRMKVLYR